MTYSQKKKVDQGVLKKLKDVILNVLNVTCEDEQAIEMVIKLEEKGLKLMKVEPGD